MLPHNTHTPLSYLVLPRLPPFSAGRVHVLCVKNMFIPSLLKQKVILLLLQSECTQHHKMTDKSIHQRRKPDHILLWRIHIHIILRIWLYYCQHEVYWLQQYLFRLNTCNRRNWARSRSIALLPRITLPTNDAVHSSPKIKGRVAGRLGAHNSSCLNWLNTAKRR